MDADSIVDERAGLHLDGLGRKHFKPHPGRRDGLEIVRIGEEAEHFFAWPREPKLGLEAEFFHSCGELIASS